MTNPSTKKVTKPAQQGKSQQVKMAPLRISKPAPAHPPKIHRMGERYGDEAALPRVHRAGSEGEG